MTKAGDDHENGLEVMAPAKGVLRAGGEDIEVMPARLQELAQMLRHLKPILNDLQSIGDEKSITDVITDAFVEHADALLAAAAVGVRREETWVLDLPPDEQLEVIAFVIEVNLDFFVQRLGPQISRVMDRIAK